jgi:nicotinamidase-related amidase
LTQECQNGAIGDGALWPALADAATPIRANVERLVRAARSAGVLVAHALVGKRPDLLGSNTNAPLYRAATRPGRLQVGTYATRLLPELDDDDRDLRFVRTHGISPVYRTGLDAAFRNAGVRTVVVCGVSVNVAIFSATMDLVNASYRVVVVRDAVAGVPSDYAASVVDNSLSLLATITTTQAMCEEWEGT